MEGIKSYDLSRRFWNWAFENPELMSPSLASIYFFAIEHCNRLGGKKKFGFPSQMTMDAVGISKHQTYVKYFNQLVELGFIEVIQKSKNQYSANIISIPHAMPEKGKALDKAFIKHKAKQTPDLGQSTRQSTQESDGNIDKQINNKQINNDDGIMDINNIEVIEPLTVDSFYGLTVLEKHYLSDLNKRVVDAVLGNPDNKFKDREHLEKRLKEFTSTRTENGELTKTPLDFASHFRSWHLKESKGKAINNRREKIQF